LKLDWTMLSKCALSELSKSVEFVSARENGGERSRRGGRGGGRGGRGGIGTRGATAGRRLRADGAAKEGLPWSEIGAGSIGAGSHAHVVGALSASSDTIGGASLSSAAPVIRLFATRAL